MDKQSVEQNNDFTTAESVIKPGLDRMEKMLASMQPDISSIRFIHIAGTNGKGSLGSYCVSILSAAGYKVGWFSSPHLHRKTECIRIISGSPGLASYLVNETHGEISAEKFITLNDQIQSAVNKFAVEEKDIPSEFERLTMAALLHFSINKCDWVIWEAGMGGKDDATNIIEHPAACMITAIGLDHLQWLGESYEKIADHKSGIIKYGSPVYLYNPKDAITDSEAAERVAEIISQKCQDTKSSLRIVSKDDLVIEYRGMEGQVFHFKNDYAVRTYRISQIGIYQPQLAAMAINLFRDLKIEEKYIDEGLSKAVWPGRMEICRKKSDRNEIILLDGAHNPQGCDALEQSLAYLLPGEKIVFLIGILADKDAEAMLAKVIKSPGYKVQAIVCTRPNNLRAMSAAVLSDIIAVMTGRSALRLQFDSNRMYNSADHVFFSDDAVEAVSFALALSAGERLPLCAFGSLYLAGIVRPLLLASETT